MEADWSVELAADDPVLEMPWASPDGKLHWQDLRHHPELIPSLAECQAFPEFIEPLHLINSHAGQLVTAKCDAFAAEPTEPAEELFGSWRMVGYIDILFSDSAHVEVEGEFSTIPANFEFAVHEQFARDFCGRLNKLSESGKINATIEVVIRRCVYQCAQSEESSKTGFYLTLYVVGYGENSEEARKQWADALDACARSCSTPAEA